MKKILVICLFALLGTGVCMADGKDNKTAKKEMTTVFAADIDCDHCAKKILNNIPSLGKGIKDVKVDVAKKEITVVYDSAKNNDDTIVKGLASLKVKAEAKKGGK